MKKTTPISITEHADSGWVTFTACDRETGRIIAQHRCPEYSMQCFMLRRLYEETQLSVPWYVSDAQWDTLLRWAIEEDRNEARRRREGAG